MGAGSRFYRYIFPVLTAGAALAARLLVDPVLGTRIPYATYYIAITLSTVTGGALAGAIAMALGGLAAVYFVLPPRHTLLIHGADSQLGFALYLFVSTILIGLGHRDRKLKLKLQEEISTREKAEAKERLHRQKLEITLSSIGDGVIATDARESITFINRVAADLTGWTPAEAIGQPLETVFSIRDEETNALVENPTRRAIRERKVIGLAKPAVLLSKDGRRIPIDDSGAAIIDAQAEVIGAVLVFRDVSEIQARESELRKTLAEAESGRRTLEAIMNYIPEGLTIADAPDVNVRMVSRHGTELIGRPSHLLENTTANEHTEAWGIYRPDGRTRPRPEELPLTRAVARGEVITGEEWVMRRPNGEPLYILCNAGPIRDADGRVTGGLAVWRDVSERRRLEEKLRESAKLESLGILAGGIAHDFNNLLTGILGNASLLLEEAPEGSVSCSYAEGISQAAERAAKLTQQMLAYSGRGRFLIEPLDLSSYIRETTPLIQSSIPKYVELRLDLEESPLRVDADAAQLQQLIMNLVINGAEAIGPSGGRVTVATKSAVIDETYIRTLLASEHIEPGAYAMIEVTDTGCGMDEATVKRIFDPFFTTKFTGRGLGLAAVHGIVRGHKGAMKVYSTPGSGTTFRVLLPACVEGADNKAEAFIAPPAEQVTGTILVIDDEELVRSTANSALRRLGYTVITASDGQQGIEICREMNGQVSAVLLDLSMPGMTGEETMRELRKIRHDIPIVLSSGFSESEALHRFAGQGLAGFLQKPYTFKMLAERVQAATAGK